MSVIYYVTEEVSRQGHDVLKRDGIERVGWMLNAWSHMLEYKGKMEISIIELIGSRIEPYKNINPSGEPSIRSCGVRVGSRVCPPPQEVRGRLKRLLELEPSMTPLEFYKEFELIHPFVDGNGRTGKILLNWKNGTLLNPIFPPADIFGEPIRNP